MSEDSWLLAEFDPRENTCRPVSGGGKWYTEDRFQYVLDADEVRNMTEDDPFIEVLMEGDEVFQVKFMDVKWQSFEGGWTDSGYDGPEIWLEYDIAEFYPSTTNKGV